MNRPLLLASLLLTAALPAQTAPPSTSRPYTQLYVFGDSYSDTGAGYVDSNGPTAVAYLAQRLSIPFTHYGDPQFQNKGLNFAVSAARTGHSAGRRYRHGIVLGLGMRYQVAEFAALLKSGDLRFDPAATLFFLAGGLNDHDTNDGYTRLNEEAGIDTLYALGARRFMVALLPVHIPFFAAVGQRLNPELAKIPSEERARHPDIRIANSNWGPFFDQIITHPAQYGLTNTTTPCRPAPNTTQTICASPSTYFYYSIDHPSTGVHRMVGDMLYTESLTQTP